MTDLIQQLKSLGEVLHGDFTQEQVTSAFTSGAQIILDGRTLDRDGFYAMQKARVSFMDSEPILYHAVAQAGNVGVSPPLRCYSESSS